MGDYVAFDNQCIQEMQASNASILQALEAINPPNDSSLFIQLVSKPWPEPVDITFESAAEFDTSSLATDVTNVFVLITLQKNLVEIDTLQKDVTTQTKTIDGLKTLKDAYEKDPKLGDAVEVWQNIIDGERVQLLKEGLKLKYQTQNDVIRSAVGDIQLVPHQATKTTSSGSCAVCQQSFSLFGKGIQCTGLISFLFFSFLSFLLLYFHQSLPYPLFRQLAKSKSTTSACSKFPRSAEQGGACLHQFSPPPPGPPRSLLRRREPRN